MANNKKLRSNSSKYKWFILISGIKSIEKVHGKVNLCNDLASVGLCLIVFLLMSWTRALHYLCLDQLWRSSKILGSVHLSFRYLSPMDHSSGRSGQPHLSLA